MIRILLVAPTLGLQVTPEIRDLTTMHRVTVLSDVVTARDVYQAAKGGYDVLHFATHSNDTYVELGAGQLLLDNDLLQIVRMSGAKLVFFNSCHAGRLAHYLVGHGLPLAVHTNKELNDADAWKFPMAFYDAVQRLGNGTPIAYVRAFEEANDGEGLYGLAIAPAIASVWAMVSSVTVVEKKGLTKPQIWFLVLVSVFLIWLLVLSILQFPQ